MKIVDDVPSLLSALDRPNSYIGRSVPRPNLHRLTQGRGQYISDVVLPLHVVSPTADSELGAKGAGEAGTAGAPGSVMNAINDALRPLGAQPLTDMPFTPDKILGALGKV